MGEVTEGEKDLARTRKPGGHRRSDEDPRPNGQDLRGCPKSIDPNFLE